MKIVMIRHLMTSGNRKKCYIGCTDEPLAEGDALADGIGKAKKSLEKAGRVEEVIASPMKRCIQTAAHLFPGQEPVLCNQMRECDFGLFEGKNYEELKDLPSYQTWLSSKGELPFPEGESPEEFKRRSVCGFEEMVDRLLLKGTQKAAMVVHGGTIMAVLQAFDAGKKEFYHWQVKNGGGYIVSIDEERWRQGDKVFREIEGL